MFAISPFSSANLLLSSTKSERFNFGQEVALIRRVHCLLVGTFGAVCLQRSGTDRARLLEESELDAVANIMSRSFQDDPFMVYLVPDSQKRSRIMPRFFRVFLKSSMRNHQAFVIGCPPKGIAIWNFPYQRRIDIASLFIAGLPRLLFQGFLIPFLNAIKVFHIIEDLQSKYLHDCDYYLNMLAVTPEWQNRGLGSKLVRPFLKKAKTESKDVYVETMTLCDVKIYEHFGFQVKEVRRVKIGFSIWALLR